jgi:hypothetical protein
MNAIRRFALPALLVASFSAVALEMEIASTRLPPCSKSRWETQAQARSPIQSFGEQRQSLNASIRGDGVDEQGQSQIVASCARAAANDIGIDLLMSAPKENAERLERRINACASQAASRGTATRIRVTNVALSVDRRCDYR